MKDTGSGQPMFIGVYRCIGLVHACSSACVRHQARACMLIDMHACTRPLLVCMPQIHACAWDVRVRGTVRRLVGQRPGSHHGRAGFQNGSRVSMGDTDDALRRAGEESKVHACTTDMSCRCDVQTSCENHLSRTCRAVPVTSSVARKMTTEQRRSIFPCIRDTMLSASTRSWGRPTFSFWSSKSSAEGNHRYQRLRRTPRLPYTAIEVHSARRRSERVGVLGRRQDLATWISLVGLNPFWIQTSSAREETASTISIDSSDKAIQVIEGVFEPQPIETLGVRHRCIMPRVQLRVVTPTCPIAVPGTYNVSSSRWSALRGSRPSVTARPTTM